MYPADRQIRYMREPERFIATILLFLPKHSRLGFVRGVSWKGFAETQTVMYWKEVFSLCAYFWEQLYI